MPDEIIGREKELEALRGLLERVVRGPCSLLLEGEPGAGKTTLWLAGCEEARASRAHVLAARPLAAEAGYAFAALGDLLAGVHDAIGELPDPLARALRVALLLEPAGDVPADERAVGLGLAAILRALAGRASVVIAVDDIQWLDAPSARVLAFAARRLGREPVALLLALRLDDDRPPPLDPDRTLPELTRVAVGPLRLGELHRLLESRLGLVLPRQTLTQVWTTSAGNPFFALELARALAERSASHIPGDPLPVPTALRELVGSRIRSLPTPSREALLYAAALADPRLHVISRALESDAETSLAHAFAEGVAEVDGGRVRFSHPLLAAAAYETTPERRRAAHRRLAGLVASERSARGISPLRRTGRTRPSRRSSSRRRTPREAGERPSSPPSSASGRRG